MGNIFSILEQTLHALEPTLHAIKTTAKGGGLGLAAGAGGGATVGALGGPIGAAFGAAIGGSVGLVLGLAGGFVATEYVIAKYKKLKGSLRRLAEFLLIIKMGASVPAKSPPMPEV